MKEAGRKIPGKRNCTSKGTEVCLLYSECQAAWSYLRTVTSGEWRRARVKGKQRPGQHRGQELQHRIQSWDVFSTVAPGGSPNYLHGSIQSLKN